MPISRWKIELSTCNIWKHEGTFNISYMKTWMHISHMKKFDISYMKLWVHIPYENKIFYIPYMTLWVPISYMNIEFSIFLIWKHGCIYQFQLSYFKSWKMILWKCCTQYVSKFGKLVSGHRTGKDQFSFQSQRKAMPKIVEITIQLQIISDH